MIRGTFLGIEVAKKGLFSARAALDATSHNIANANTVGYSRQRANLQASFPLNFPGPFVTLRPGQLGTGAEVDSITRIHSAFIEAQLHQEGGGQAMFSVLSEHFTRIEDIVGEPSEYAIGGLMEDFYNAWEDLSNDPESASARANLVSAGVALTEYVNNVDFKLDLEITNINEELRERVDRLNNLAFQVAGINKQIVQIEGSGGDGSLKANDLKDRRDLLIEEMSTLVNARVLFNNDGSVNVLIQGHPIVLGDHVAEISLQFNPADPQRPKIVFTKSRIPLEINSGEIMGLMHMRDSEIPALRENLGELITVFTNRVNVLHRQGYGLDGIKDRPFFTDTEFQRINAIIPLPAGTSLDTTLDELGVTSGDFYVQGTRIEIDAAEILPGQALTLRQLCERIEQRNLDVRLKIDESGGFPRLVLSQYNPLNDDATLVIKSGSSSFLAVTGLAGAAVQDLAPDPPYTNSLHNLSLHPSILQNLDAVAAAGDDGLGFPGPGDNRTALAIADLKNKRQDVFGTTFNEQYQSVISILGSSAQNADRSRISQTLVVDQLESRKQEISGVNLDEEAVNLIKYQKAFEASARAMTTLDEVLSLIVSRLGISGR